LLIKGEREKKVVLVYVLLSEANFQIAVSENVYVSVGRNMRAIYVLSCIVALVLTSTVAFVSVFAYLL
jgi:hypothetical protein